MNVNTNKYNYFLIFFILKKEADIDVIDSEIDLTYVFTSNGLPDTTLHIYPCWATVRPLACASSVDRAMGAIGFSALPKDAAAHERINPATFWLEGNLYPLHCSHPSLSVTLA